MPDWPPLKVSGERTITEIIRGPVPAVIVVWSSRCTVATIRLPCKLGLAGEGDRVRPWGSLSLKTRVLPDEARESFPMLRCVRSKAAPRAPTRPLH